MSNQDHNDVQLALRHRELFTEEFLSYLPENLHVWGRFEDEAYQVWLTGRKHYSARTIIEVIRHNSLISDNDGEFKINNNNAPDFSRLLMLKYPQMDGFFETRKQKGSERKS